MNKDSYINVSHHKYVNDAEAPDGFKSETHSMYFSFGDQLNKTELLKMFDTLFDTFVSFQKTQIEIHASYDGNMVAYRSLK